MGWLILVVVIAFFYGEVADVCLLFWVRSAKKVMGITQSEKNVVPHCCCNDGDILQLVPCSNRSARLLPSVVLLLSLLLYRGRYSVAALFGTTLLAIQSSRTTTGVPL